MVVADVEAAVAEVATEDRAGKAGHSCLVTTLRV